ncbi:uncharacterized protein LOC144129983 [Amblyomma americanum]
MAVLASTARGRKSGRQDGRLQCACVTFQNIANSSQDASIRKLIAVLAAGTTAEGPQQETTSAAAGPGYDAAASCEAASASEPPFLSTGFVAICPLGIHHCAPATSTSSQSERIKLGIECPLVSGRGGTMMKSINDLHTFFVLQLPLHNCMDMVAHFHAQIKYLQLHWSLWKQVLHSGQLSMYPAGFKHFWDSI